VLALLLVGPSPAVAASLVLGAEGRTEAVRVGTQSVTQDAFDREWRVQNATGDVVSVMTPFHRLAVAARHAAFRSDDLSPRETERVLREQGARLVIWASLHGPRVDFARYYAPRILLGAREIGPSFVQNERTAVRTEDGRYLARCVYAFPTRDIDGGARLQLVIHDAAGREVSRFSIDLETMR